LLTFILFTQHHAGERSSGKSSVLARLQGLDIAEAAVDGVALDYTYLDIFGSDESDGESVH
jgi:hypothetical protein